MLTFGTGIGTALFTAANSFPTANRAPELHGMDAEKWASAQVRTAEGLDFAWVARVNDYLLAMHKLFWPDVFILGGAVSERFAGSAPACARRRSCERRTLRGRRAWSEPALAAGGDLTEA